jgi:hypothetical protein
MVAVRLKHLLESGLLAARGPRIVDNVLLPTAEILHAVVVTVRVPDGIKNRYGNDNRGNRPADDHNAPQAMYGITLNGYLVRWGDLPSSPKVCSADALNLAAGISVAAFGAAQAVARLLDGVAVPY